MDKKSIVNDLYQAAVISVLAVGYSMLGKKILKITPPSVQKFDLEDTGKLVAGSSYLFHRLSADNIDTERKRHDAAIEALKDRSNRIDS